MGLVLLHSVNLLDFGVCVDFMNLSDLRNFSSSRVANNQRMSILVLPLGKGLVIKCRIDGFHALLDLSEIKDVLICDSCIED